MKELDYILNWTEKLKIQIHQLPFDKRDIRKDFYGLIYDVAYCYYKGFLFLNVAEFIDKDKVSFKEELNSYETHLLRMAEVTKHPMLRVSHFNSLNRSFLIDSWSVFELCVTTFCNGLANDKELNSLLESNFLEVTTIFKKTEINENEKERLKKLTVKKNLTHIPINRKINFLFKKVNNYNREINQDKGFLEFFGKLRNTLHTNFIYYGNNYEYNFGDAHFVFENEKLVKWYDPFNATPELYFDLVAELNNIWKEITYSIVHSDVIYYPDEEQE